MKGSLLIKRQRREEEQEWTQGSGILRKVAGGRGVHIDLPYYANTVKNKEGNPWQPRRRILIILEEVITGAGGGGLLFFMFSVITVIVL